MFRQGSIHIAKQKATNVTSNKPTYMPMWNPS